MSLFSEVTEFQIPNELAILRYIFKIDNVIMKAPWYQLKKNLVNTLYSMINKKADKTQNNEEQEKKPQ